MARFGLSSERRGIARNPIVDPELDALAFGAFYLLQTSMISPTGDPPYEYVDVLAEAQVLEKYTPLMRILIEKSHSWLPDMPRHSAFIIGGLGELFFAVSH
jgi:hypothetical protein